jgi:hypothetical protein
MWLSLDIETREMFHDPEIHVGHRQMAVLHLVCMRLAGTRCASVTAFVHCAAVMPPTR